RANQPCQQKVEFLNFFFQMNNKRITLSDNLTKEVIQVNDLFTNENGTIQIIHRKLINFLEQLGYGVFTKSSKFLKETLIKRKEQDISELAEVELRREVIDVL